MDMEKEDIQERFKENYSLESIREYFLEQLAHPNSGGGENPKVIENLTFDGLIEHWKQKGFNKIITMAGAGISTSAGISDFRSFNSRAYDNIGKYNLSRPTSIFEIECFLKNPEPFFAFANDLYLETFNPTPAHYFVQMLNKKGLLLRHYTQNIDSLERIAGIPDEKLVEAHGTLFSNHCLGCQRLYTLKHKIFLQPVPTCTNCDSVVRPDIVFFGEDMPDEFYNKSAKDFQECDLLIIMGTALDVQPFASLIDKVPPNCIRLLINNDAVGSGEQLWYISGRGLMYNKPENTRDVAYIGSCDDGVYAVANGLGWGEELRELVISVQRRLDRDTISDIGSDELDEEITEIEVEDEFKSSGLEDHQQLSKTGNSDE